MLLTIHHTSTYRYDTPVPYSLQRLRMTPKSIRSQNVKNWNVECTGAIREVVYRDGFDNVCELIRHERNATEITILASGKVETYNLSGVAGDEVKIAHWVYQRQTNRTQPGPKLLALKQRVAGTKDRLECLHQLMGLVADEMVYETGSTNVETDAETALNNGHGVCQDQSHAFISVARLLDIPARYVSGYLMMPDVTDQVATHAWADAFSPGLGWVGFDAANRICPNEHYVRIATGLDYRDAAPISGIRHGIGGEMLDVHVKVEQ